MEARERIIAALDFSTALVAREFAAAMAKDVGGFKVGSQLFTACGPDLVWHLADMGLRVFLDLKFHDIANTVAAASGEAARLGALMFNVHCTGGRAMMRAAREAVDDLMRKPAMADRPRALILGVTLLTSLDYPALTDLFPFLNPDLSAEEQDRFMRDQVLHLARLAQEVGLDGVVASPREARSIREACGSGFFIVTPGVNLGGGPIADQKRTGTAGQAISDGADFVVVGRAFTQAKDPNLVAQQMAAEIASALEERS